MGDVTYYIQMDHICFLFAFYVCDNPLQRSPYKMMYLISKHPYLFYFWIRHWFLFISVRSLSSRVAQRLDQEEDEEEDTILSVLQSLGQHCSSGQTCCQLINTAYKLAEVVFLTYVYYFVK